MAQWTFPLAATDNATADGGTFDNLTQKISAVGTDPLTFLASGVVSAPDWISQTGQKYWLIPFSSIGYHHILFSFKIGGSASGPRDFILEYRIGETDLWKVLPHSPLVLPSSSSQTSITLTDIPLPEDASDQPLVLIRLLMTTNTAINGSSVGASGTNRLDDIFINASPIEESEEEPEIPLCTGAKENVTLNEILPAPKPGESEYAELHNSGTECVDLAGWSFQDESNPPFVLPQNTVIEAGSYLTFIRSFSLNNSGDTLTLRDTENEERSSVSYPAAPPNYSYSFNGTEWLFSSFQTPGAENIFDAEEVEENPEAGSGVILNEIFPNPTTDEGENEFIELSNLETEEKNLKGWGLMDASKKPFIFTEDILLSPNSFLSIPRSTFGFSLNNTGAETITLLDPQGTPLSEVSYTSTQEDFSYSFDGSEWRWTKKITPGEANEFSKTPKLNLTSKTEAYADIPLAFSLSIKNGNGPYRYSWDFGDGRRSSLKEPKHTYEKTGSYKGSVTVRAQNGIVEKGFTIRVKKYPSASVVITALHPNPEGKDTDKEWVEIKNMSQKKVDLTGWKIATGSDELTNHLLVPGLMLQSGQTLRLTRKHSAFSLNNSAGTVELRYPNDKAASQTRYEEKAIPEGVTCINVKGRCDFKEETKKESKGKKEDKEGQVKGALDTPSENNVPNEPAKYPTKKELLQRMGNDFNLLMNQLLLDSLPPKQK